jgi:uncharacterized protein (TIGR00251 family)
MSAPLPSFLRAHADGTFLRIKLQPRASQEEIGQPVGDELRIRVTAPPVDAAANEALLRLLAKTIGCPRGAVKLVRGHTSRHKLVLITGCPAELVREKLSPPTARS